MKLINTLLAVTAVLLGTARSVPAADSPATETHRKLLSRHETVAQFEGVTEHKCPGATKSCPDRCGNSGDMATFKIIKYTAYENPGDGDPRQTKFQFLVQDNMKNLKVPAEIKRAVESLKVGDYVVLNWRHDYVTYVRSKSPERPIQLLKPITKEEADKLPAALEAPPKAPK
ncbi:MAG: hypothetical protein NTW21_43900 [Verrucomicrobia bacterium]|nr:hypothetical protein [Verrucomicrobiota bacterium]